MMGIQNGDSERILIHVSFGTRRTKLLEAAWPKKC